MTAERQEKEKRKGFGCFRTGLVVALVVVIGFKIVMAYLERPAALYQRWIGTAVPSDVTALDGLSKFYITESVLWLSFNAPPARIEEIVGRLEMQKIEPSSKWSEDLQGVSIDGKNYSASIFTFGLRYFDPVQDDLVVYWLGSVKRLDGWVLYYSATTREAYWTSIPF